MSEPFDFTKSDHAEAAAQIRDRLRAELGEPDLFRSEVAPGLTIVTDHAGRVLVEGEPPESRRYEIPDVARLVVAVETARDVGSGPPAEGSPMQAAITGMTEAAARLDRAVGLNRLGLAEQAWLAADVLWQLAGDLQYGRLPQAWMDLPRSGAVPRCATCYMLPRVTTRGPVALRHRPGCTGQEQ